MPENCGNKCRVYRLSGRLGSDGFGCVRNKRTAEHITRPLKHERHGAGRNLPTNPGGDISGAEGDQAEDDWVVTVRIDVLERVIDDKRVTVEALWPLTFWYI